MGLSDVQLHTLIDYIKTTNIVELDISWNKLPIHLVSKLYLALEENRSIQSLNLGFIAMTSIDKKAPPE